MNEASQIESLISPSKFKHNFRLERYYVLCKNNNHIRLDEKLCVFRYGAYDQRDGNVCE